MNNLLFLDTETTGRGPEDRIIQLAYKYGNEKVNLLFKPPIPISFEAMAVHHITNEMVADKPTFAYTGEFKRTFEERTLVAHNAVFDVDMLRREGINPKQIICTLKVTQNLFDLSMYKLQFLRYSFDLKVGEVKAHDAEGDIEVLEALFTYLFTFMAREHPELDESEILGTMIKWTSEPLLLRRIGFGKYKGMVFAEIPKDYLEWLKKQTEIDEDLKYTINFYLNKNVQSKF